MVSPYMPYSPAGHPIEVVEGDPTDVKNRGDQITALGDQMREAWSLITRLVDDGAEMEGDAVDTLRDVADEVSGDLDKAGELYQAVGPHISTYGSELDGAQSAMRPLVTSLETLWSEYYTLSNDAESAQWGVPAKPDDDADQSEKDDYDKAHEAAKDAQDAADAKKSDWDETALKYDAEWDSWHTVFTTAATNIREEMSGKIKDSWKDNLRGLLDFLADVLAVAGIVLCVLAIIIGGPIIMALAAVVAVATLLVQIAKFGVGDGDWVDLTFAIIGCIPFIGPAAKFFSGAGQAGGVMNLVKTSFAADGARLFGSAPSVGAWFTRVNQLGGSGFGGGVLKFTTEFLSGKGMDEWAGMGSRGIDAVDTLASVWSAQLGIAGQIKDTAEGAWSGAFGPGQNPFG